MLDFPRPRSLRITILNDGRDTIALLTNWLAAHGHRAVSGTLQDMRPTEVAAAEFIRTTGADVVLFDVGLPYICNWDFGAALQLLPDGEDVPFLFTTADKAALEDLVGPTDAYELTGTAANLNGLLARLYEVVSRPAPLAG